MDTPDYLKLFKGYKNSKSVEPPNSAPKIFSNLAKRVFDFVMALIGLILLLPIFGVIGVLIKRDSPGPVFFWGSRMGKDRRVFRMLKFRTMHERPESYQGPRVTAQGDDRITRLGQILRDTKINELPQLWNVLIGEMSLVGPRPEDSEIAKTWPEDASAEILSVRPGITSPASILYHDEERMLSKSNLMGDFMNILPNKMRLDRLYVRYHSFFSDLDIVLWTLAILIPYWAQVGVQEGHIFGGPLSRLMSRNVTWFARDMIISLVAVALCSVVWRSRAPLDWGFEPLAILAFVQVLVFSVISSFLGSNKVVWHRAKAEDAVGLFVAGLTNIVAIWGINALQNRFQWLPYPALPSDMIFTVGLLSLYGFIAVRYGRRFVPAISGIWHNRRRASIILGERVVVVGSGEAAQIANWLLKRPMFRSSFAMVGIVDDTNPTNHGLRVEGCWILGGVNELPKLVEQYDIGVILSTLPRQASEMKYIRDLCKKVGMRLLFLNDLMWLVDRQVTQPLEKSQSGDWLDEHLETKSLHDALTEIPSQTLFQDRLRHSVVYAKRYHTQHAVMFVELEGFSPIQNALDRQDLLKESARRLTRCIRESDTLARYKEHDFALLLENIPAPENAKVVLNRIINAISEPFYIRGQQVDINPRVRFCLCNGQSCELARSSQDLNIRKCYESADV